MALLSALNLMNTSPNPRQHHKITHDEWVMSQIIMGSHHQLSHEKEENGSK